MGQEDKIRWFLTRVGGDGVRVVIEQMPFSVGRDASCHLQLDSERASRLHAQFTPSTVPNCLFLRDHRSTNGTYVNGVRFIEPVPVGHGDLLRFAEEDWTLEAGEPASDSPTVRGISLDQFPGSTTKRKVMPEAVEELTVQPEFD
ncbi:MAG: FHA domain-containing protein [Lysobacterales bacterium]